MSAVSDLSEHWRHRARKVMAMAKTSRDARTHADLVEVAATYEHLADLAASAEGPPKDAGGKRSFLLPARS